MFISSGFLDPICAKWYNPAALVPFLPPSSRGPGRSPFKAKTRVRISVGAQFVKNRSTDDVERFLSSIRFEHREKLAELRLDL